MVHNLSSSAWEIETGRLKTEDHPLLYSEWKSIPAFKHENIGVYFYSSHHNQGSTNYLLRIRYAFFPPGFQISIKMFAVSAFLK